jgi:hypothetical protein
MLSVKGLRSLRDGLRPPLTLSLDRHGEWQKRAGRACLVNRPTSGLIASRWAVAAA